MRNLFLAAAAASMVVPVIPAPASAKGYNGKIWRDSKGRYRCKRPNGTTGLIVGAAAPRIVPVARTPLVSIARPRSAPPAAGALLGRSIDRNRVRCR